MSIGKAQAKVIADGFLDSLGSAPPTDKLSIVEAILAEAGGEFILTAQGNLEKVDAIDTGSLQRELTLRTEVLGKSYLLTVGYPKNSKEAVYYDFVNKGVRGVKGGGNSPYKFKNTVPSIGMVTAILQWYRRQGKSVTNAKRPVSGLERKRKGLKQTTDAAGSLRSLAYATAVNIKKYGKKPTKYFDNAVRDTFGSGLIEALQTALSAEVRLQIRAINND